MMDNKYGYYGDWANDQKSRNADTASQNEASHLAGDGHHQGKVNESIAMQGVSSGPPPVSIKSAAGRDRKGYEDSDGDGQDFGSDTPKKKSVARIVKRFSEKCSMQGPPYIVSSTWWLSRFLWTLLLLAALGAMSYHLVYLCKTYFAWPTKNKITLGFSSLQFPAVTVCNVNPVRISRIDELSEDFRQLVGLVDAKVMGQMIDRLSPSSSFDDARQTRKRRQATLNPVRDIDSLLDDEDDDYDNELDVIDFGVAAGNFSNSRAEVDPEETLDGYDDSWESETRESSFAAMERTFRELYASEERAARIKAGYRINEMLISCSFAGKACYPGNFTLSTSSTYGNCYTLEYRKFISKESGPLGGLELLFYLDTDDYITGITPDDGMQVSVHPLNTMPFPGDEGMAVAAGFNTLMSLKLIQIERMGEPYGICYDSGDYFKNYSVHYTRQACFKLCEQTAIHDRCQCRDETKEDLNRAMKVFQYKPCRKAAEIACMLRVQWSYHRGKISCDCSEPCTESKYQKTLSYRPWPNKDYAEQVLLKTVCRRVSEAKCNKLKAKDPLLLAREFVKLNIFYEDLNYENITEEADYEDVQFISDVGGTLGLWVGLSALSIMEVVQLVVELAKHFCLCRSLRASK